MVDSLHSILVSSKRLQQHPAQFAFRAALTQTLATVLQSELARIEPGQAAFEASLARSFALSLLNAVYKEEGSSSGGESKSLGLHRSTSTSSPAGAVLPTTTDAEALNAGDRVLTLLLHVTALVKDARLTQHVLPAVIDRLNERQRDLHLVAPFLVDIALSSQRNEVFCLARVT